MKKVNKDLTSNKFNFVVLGLGLFAFLILIQLFRWQIIYHDRYETESESLTKIYIPLQPEKGIIYSNDMSVLSIDEPLWLAYISVSNHFLDKEKFLNEKDQIINQLSENLILPKEDISAKLNSTNLSYIPIQHYIDNETKNKLEEINIFSLYFEKEYKRVYPNGKLASNLIGFVGLDNDGNEIGRYGVTGYYWKDLSGVEGFKQNEQDAQGNILLSSNYSPLSPKKGKSIVLTIDSHIQRIVEEKLEEGVLENKAVSGTAIIMNPQTGQIIAMANYPTYDPNFYSVVTDNSVYKNKAVSDSYEFGSVNKVITVASAMELGLIDENYLCNDSTGYLQVGDKTIYTWDHKPDGIQTPADVLKNSNNVCAAEIGLKMTPNQFYGYLEEFGLTNKIGLGLEDESKGWCPYPEEWRKIDLAAASYGQMFSATPMQIISAISAIANDGERMQPYLIKSILDDDKKRDFEPIVLSNPISEITADKVSIMMHYAANEGSIAKFFKNYTQYKIAGKSGTAQIPDPETGGYNEKLTNATYIGFAPYDNPQFIMLVWLEKPEKHELSSYTAVPVWANIFGEVKDKLIKIQ